MAERGQAASSPSRRGGSSTTSSRAEEERDPQLEQPGRHHQNVDASKLETDCSKEQRASLDCISQNYGSQHEACVPQFEAYKKCRAAENERRRAENASRLRFW